METASSELFGHALNQTVGRRHGVSKFKADWRNQIAQGGQDT